MSQINSNTKDDFQVVLLLSCFVGHPVCLYGGKRLHHYNEDDFYLSFDG